MTASLNLLRYPVRLPWAAPVPARALAVGLLAGVAGGGAWAHWAWQQQQALLSLRAHLQTQAQGLARQQAQQQALQERQALQRSLLERSKDWQAQRQRVLQLHGVLAEQASRGLRVERWQFDGRKLTLHAWLPETQALPPLIAALSAAWPQGWALQDLGQAADTGMAFVLEAPGAEPTLMAGKTAP